MHHLKLSSFYPLAERVDSAAAKIWKWKYNLSNSRIFSLLHVKVNEEGDFKVHKTLIQLIPRPSQQDFCCLALSWRALERPTVQIVLRVERSNTIFDILQKTL